MKPPYVVKPVDEGSSFGVVIVKEDQLASAADHRVAEWRYGDAVMVERYVHGRELTCGVMGDVALGVIEIVPTGHASTTTTRNMSQAARNTSCPAQISPNIYQKIQTLALKAHQAIGCRGVSRVRLPLRRPLSEDGELIWLEVNTQPGMTPTSLVPEMAAHAGIRFGELVALDGGGRVVFAVRAGQGRDDRASAKPGCLGCPSATGSCCRGSLRRAGALRRQPARRRVSTCRAMPALVRRRASLRCDRLYGMSLGGHMPGRRAGGHRAAVGFAIDDVKVSGQERDLRDRHPRSGSASTAATSLVALRRRRGARAHRSAALGRDARRSARSIPTTIEVKLEEREPFAHLAAWQRARRSIERNGSVIAPLRRQPVRRRCRWSSATARRERRRRSSTTLRPLARAPRRGQGLRPRRRAAAGTCASTTASTVQLPETATGRGDRRARCSSTASNGLLARDIAAVDLRLDDRTASSS